MGVHPFLDLNPRNITAGIVAALLAITGPPALILEAAAKGNLSACAFVPKSNDPKKGITQAKLYHTPNSSSNPFRQMVC